MKNVDPHKIIFIDIETVPGHSSFDKLDDTWQRLWKAKADKTREEDQDESDFYFENAGFYAEFGKIVCIVIGMIANNEGKDEFRKKSFVGDEKELLQSFTETLNGSYFKRPDTWWICGHNITAFDVPFICRRMIVHKIPIPKILDVTGLKPWEMRQLDTLTLWRFGNFRGSVSLEVLALLFGIPTPKEDIKGEDVGAVYWQEQDIDRIEQYCKRDVETTARIYLRIADDPPRSRGEARGLTC